MGILREKLELDAPIRLEDHLQDYMFLESDNEADGTVEEELSESAPPSPRRRRQKKGNGKAALIGQGPAQPRSGRRKQRRIESARALAALVDTEEICEDLSDMLPDSISAFTRLFLQQHQMEAWSEFMDKSEEQQNCFLNQGSYAEANVGGKVLGGSKTDNRATHPAYSAENCFRKIDSRFRALLTHRSLPWAKMEHYEGELADFFMTSPDGVWISCIEDPYDRLLVHAISQYLSLRSQSYDIGGKRETQVENRKPYFVPPRETMVDYMIKRREK